MGLSEHDTIDLVSEDPATGAVVLSMVEVRAWGDRGALLPDLQAKVSTYLGYALDGQLHADYPALRGRPVRSRLHYGVAPGVEEQRFIEIVRRRYLEPEGIAWEQVPVPPA